MKKLLLCIAILFMQVVVFAQYKGGMEIGGNLMGADFILEEPIATQDSWGIRLGYVGEYQISDHLYARGAALINQRGFKFGGERWALSAIDVPVNLGYALNLNDKNLKLFIDGGFNFAYNFRAFTKSNGEIVTLEIGNEEGDIKMFSTGFNVGGGLQFSEKIKVRVNYYSGLTNLLRTEGDEWKNHVIGLSLNFFFKK